MIYVKCLRQTSGHLSNIQNNELVPKVVNGFTPNMINPVLIADFKQHEVKLTLDVLYHKYDQKSKK